MSEIKEERICSELDKKGGSTDVLYFPFVLDGTEAYVQAFKVIDLLCGQKETGPWFMCASKTIMDVMLAWNMMISRTMSFF